MTPLLADANATESTRHSVKMLTAGPKVPPVRADSLIHRKGLLTLQPKFGQPVLPNLNVRHLCPNCRTDPPNIVEEYSKGDLVRLSLSMRECADD